MDISTMLEVQVNEVKEADSKENVTPKDLVPSTANIPSSISQDEITYYKALFGSDISVVRFHRLHCTACDMHIGSAPGDSSNMFEHPVLHTLLCANCREFYGDGTFEQGDDATDMFCRWCANGGNLYCCSFCSNTFCYKCIKRNFDPIQRKRIEEDEKWKCFVCDPTKLYPARATCWALLEYIQRMNRLFQNNSSLPQAEIDEKMILDETKCCPRKRRRKRRKLGSMSEDDDDVTYNPNYIPVNPLKRKKRGRRPKYLVDGNLSNMSQSGASEDSSVDHSELLPSLLSCEQTMIEGENTIVNTDSTIVSQPPPKPQPSPQPQTNSLSHKIDSAPVVQRNVYKTIMNVVPPSNFLPPKPQVMPVRPVHGALAQINLYPSVHCVPAPMVTIPNQSTGILNKIRLQKFPAAEHPPPLAALSSTVIEIDSDSEEGVDVGPSRDSRSFKDHVDNNKAVPVALVSSKNNFSQRKQGTLERHHVKTLNQRLLPYSQEVNSILTALKTKLQGVFDVWKQEELKKCELNEARDTIKQFHREMRETVNLLACINDRVVREYNRWKRLQIKASAIQASDSNSASSKAKEEEISLDMSCVNESDSDIESDSEGTIIIPSEFVGSTSAVDGIKSFRKQLTVTRAVGNDDSALLVDKSVQLYDVELQDYDKCISHSTVKIFNQQSKTQDNSSTCSVEEESKQLHKYEEQFINYLQKRIESEDIEEEVEEVAEETEEKENEEAEKESKDLPDPNETPLKDLIEANSPFISEMLETMDKPPVVSNNVNSSNNSNEEDDNSEPLTVQVTTNSVNPKTVNDLEQMVNHITNAINNKKSEAHEKQFSTSDEVRVVNLLKNNEQDSSRTKRCSINSTKGLGDTCTIIDD